MIVKKDGSVREHLINEPTKVSKCSFERIYFSRGSDKDIYNERKELGRLIVEPVLETVDHDLDNTVFSFIPNTAEISFYGMVKGLESYLNVQKIEEVQKLGPNASKEELEKIINRRARIEKLPSKTRSSEPSLRRMILVMIWFLTFMILRTEGFVPTRTIW